MIDQKELFSLGWLHKKLGLSDDVNLYYLIGNLRLNKHRLYYNTYLVKSGDSTRSINAPEGDLLLVQDRINKFVLSKFNRHPNSYGFMGGTCLQAAERHLGFKSVLMFDLKNAFSNTGYNNVFNIFYNNGDITSSSLFSFYVARFITDLCTIGNIDRNYGRSRIQGKIELCVGYDGMLPQGSSTSPKIFELCLRDLDDQITTFTNRFGVRYTRYADNFFFSSETEGKFPSLARNIVLSMVRKYYPVHKIRQYSHGQMCRILGLNLTPYCISNTRDFKRRLKGALHHLEYTMERGSPIDESNARSFVSGLLGFAISDKLPIKIRSKIKDLYLTNTTD